jgi:hypothetical protein
MATASQGWACLEYLGCRLVFKDFFKVMQWIFLIDFFTAGTSGGVGSKLSPKLLTCSWFCDESAIQMGRLK